jgi:hypothetical protein
MTYAKQVGYGAILGAAVMFGSSAHAVMGSGGTIVITGALVAPSYSISMQSAAHSSAFATQTVAARKDADATTVTFTALPGGLPSADVTVTTKGERFIDGNSRRITRNKNGAYHIGATGGVLSIPAQAANGATIVTSYQ